MIVKMVAIELVATERKQYNPRGKTVMNGEDFTEANDENLDPMLDNSFLMDTPQPALFIQNAARNLAASDTPVEEQSIQSKISMDVLV